MKYTDRSGNITLTENAQDKFLRHLYQDWGGRLGLRLLIRPFVTRIGGRFLRSSFSARLIPGFIKRNRIDLSEYEKEEYSSYNDFFTRRIRPECRPIDAGENTIVSPCDGKATVVRINPESGFLIKDTRYTLEELLESAALAKRFRGGYAVILRLTVDNYHRYCYPVSGQKSRQVRIPGLFHTVNPAANDVLPVYVKNQREYCLIRTQDAGTVLQMEVGALMVGRISNYEQGESPVQKGGEKGRFEFGGSTVILLFQNGRVRIDEDLLYHTERGYETILKMGEHIGECKLSKRTGPAD